MILRISVNILGVFWVCADRLSSLQALQFDISSFFNLQMDFYSDPGFDFLFFVCVHSDVFQPLVSIKTALCLFLPVRLWLLKGTEAAGTQPAATATETSLLPWLP